MTLNELEMDRNEQFLSYHFLPNVPKNHVKKIKNINTDHKSFFLNTSLMMKMEGKNMYSKV